jgi:hypothetical protein
VASHTATSRNAFDSTCAASSNGNEVTTAAPASSNGNEVTTASPVTSNSNEVTTAAPGVPPPPTPTAQQFVFIDAQFVLSGAGWLNVQGNAGAWAALPAALRSDLAALVGRSAADIGLNSVTAAANALTVSFTVRSDSLAQAARIAALIRDDVPATAPLPATLGVYSSVGGQSAADVSVASHTATSRDVWQSAANAANANAHVDAQADALAAAQSSAPATSLWMLSAAVGLFTTAAFVV